MSVKGVREASPRLEAAESVMSEKAEKGRITLGSRVDFGATRI